MKYRHRLRSAATIVSLAFVSIILMACGGDSNGGILDKSTNATASAPSTAVRGASAAPSTPSRNATPTPAATVPANALDWQRAMLDASKSLPGDYVPPHPGADGKVCADRTCGTTGFDDRNHVNGAIPICTKAQLDAKNVSDPLCYTTNPPTSGPHAQNFPDFKIYTSPVSKEMLVHAMEHGGVVVWYNTKNPAVINQMSQVVNGAIASKKLVVMSPYDGLEPDTIALTSWTRLDKFQVTGFTQKRVLDFIEAHSKRFNPEGF